jgi:hypothetical protein
MRVAFFLFVLASAAVTKRHQQQHDSVVMPDTQSEPQWVRDPSGAEEESFIWTMTDPETGVATRDWVNAHAYRELQRWVTFVDVLAQWLCQNNFGGYIAAAVKGLHDEMMLCNVHESLDYLGFYEPAKDLNFPICNLPYTAFNCDMSAFY